MKTNFALIFTLFSVSFFYAQQGSIIGVVKDGVTGESIPFASVKYAEGKGTTTDLDGRYTLKLDYGTYVVSFSSVGFDEIKETVEISEENKNVTLSPKLKTPQLTEVEVVSDVAIERETPVAFTNISPAKIQQELASQDLPMILNNTPSVYATKQGGGDGDARITIRGFSQRNLAVMIDGVPVNDMENGWVYWSNWFGLDMTTRSIQVQRGLGASKLAIPSVGGTMNILTKGLDQKQEGMFKMEVGSNGFLRPSLSYNSGKLKGDWGFSTAVSGKIGDGWVDETYTKGFFYFAKVEKKIKNHLLSLSAFGAPQSHGQRSYKQPISVFDRQYARDLGVPETSIQEYDQAFGGDLGFRYNQHWGVYVDKDGNKQFLRDKINYYHKPQITLKDFWSISDKFYISNILYTSIGQGGGTGLDGGVSSSSPPIDASNNQIDAQLIYDGNTKGDPLFGPPIDANYHPTELKSASILRSSINNHYWFGLLSTGTYKPNDVMTYSGGIDLRTYRGEHYAKVYDLLGGDYFIQNYNATARDGDANQSNVVKKLNDKINYYDEGLVRWSGLFGQAEYKKGLWSAFVNVSGAMVGYNGRDFFRPKILDIGDTTLQIGYHDTINYNGQTYTRESQGLKTYESGWKWLPGGTIKLGANYNINENSNIFFNTGLLSKSPQFNNVINQQNEFVKNTANEKVLAFEMGYMFKKKALAINVNGYYTRWIDRPYEIREQDADNETYSANVLMDALHTGIELEVAYDITKKITIEGLFSIGDWTWQSGADSIKFFDNSGAILKDGNNNDLTYSFDATGVHVGDAAQTQIGGSIKYDIIKGLYVKAKYIYFDRYYAAFEPGSLRGENEGRESWRIPAYGLFEFHGGYSFKSPGNTRTSVRFSILNAMNTRYISDAQNNDTFTSTTSDFDAKSASVFFGQGRTFNVSLQVTF